MGMLTLFNDSQISATWPTNLFKDDEVWGPDADEFRPERWLEQPDAAMFTYGLGYRMCVGSILSNRKLYLIFIRLIHCFQIEKYDDVDCHPVLGNMDPMSLVAMPHRCRARFTLRNEAILWRAIEELLFVC